MIDLHLQRYAFFALMAAALFGASTPLAKLLLGETPPLMLAGLLYLGSGLGLLTIKLISGRIASSTHVFNKEAVLKGHDYLWLAGATITGGVLGPILLLYGLTTSTASSVSLLLNLEGVLTVLISAWVFREAVAARIWVATLIMLLGGFILFYNPSATLSFNTGLLAVLGACFMWGVDNNLTRKISAGDPMTIVMIKGLAAGSVSLMLAYVSGAELPEIFVLLSAMLLGLFSYGISLVLFVYALRHLGSARTSAHFSTAPFIGAAMAIILLNEPLGVTFIVVLLLMIGATYLVLTEQHKHGHIHEYLVHAHLHHHDEHHRHRHEGGEGTEPHAHRHVHEPLAHAHGHLPDIHHRHRH